MFMASSLSIAITVFMLFFVLLSCYATIHISFLILTRFFQETAFRSGIGHTDKDNVVHVYVYVNFCAYVHTTMNMNMTTSINISVNKDMDVDIETNIKKEHRHGHGQRQL
jgi:hypothetical protein